MCTKLYFLRQDEDTIHWPQTLIVNLLPICYIRNSGFRCQVSGKRNMEAETSIRPETWYLTPETLVTVMSP